MNIIKASFLILAATCSVTACLSTLKDSSGKFVVTKVIVRKSGDPLVAELYIDGRRHGTTGNNIVLQSGPHRISARNATCTTDEKLVDLPDSQTPSNGGIVEVELECL
jgi:hypothetical protein